MATFTDRVHLAADTLTELHKIAALIGLKPGLFIDHPERPHYEIFANRIQKAIDAGVKMVSPRECMRVAAQARLQEHNTFERLSECLEINHGQPPIISLHYGISLYGLEHDHTNINQIF